MAIAIELTKSEQKFLVRVFGEVFGGGSTRAIQNVLGDQVSEAKSLSSKIQTLFTEGNRHISLNESQWRTVYESLNAVVYGLGPFELDTCTGFDLQQACNTNLKICGKVWGVYGKAVWSSPKTAQEDSS